MKGAGRQSGSSLIMIIGAVAVLAVLSAALVALIVNAQANSSRDRQSTRVFNATEAAVDDALSILAARWPTTAELTPQFDEAAFKTGFLDGGLASQYPGLRVSVSFYDDAVGENAEGVSYDTNGDGVVNAEDGWTYDMNGNDRVYVEAQATAGGRTARVRTLVTRDTVSLHIPRGTAFYTQGDMRSNGGSQVIGVDPGGEPPEGYGVVGYVGQEYFNQGSSSYDPRVNLYVGNYTGNPASRPANVSISTDVPNVDGVLDPRILDYLKVVATPENYYTDPTRVSDHYIAPTVSNPDPDDLTGLVYIESTTLAQYQFHGTFNSEEDPGILVVRGGSLRLDGGGEYYGIIYVEGGVVDIGNVTIHGAVICAGEALSDLGGSQTIRYNDKVWMTLSEEVTLAAKLVPNTWRELPPAAD